MALFELCTKQTKKFDTLEGYGAKNWFRNSLTHGQFAIDKTSVIQQELTTYNIRVFLLQRHVAFFSTIF